MDQFLEKTLALPLYMRDPQWRWKLALGVRADPSKSLTAFRADSSLYTAARFFRDLCQNPADHAHRRRAFPHMTVAYAVWAGASLSLKESTRGSGRWRGVIESLLLTDVPFGDFSACLAVDIHPKVVQLYHDVFFDVRSYIDSEPAVFTNVLSMADQELSAGSLSRGDDLDCIRRLFAYTWGAEAFISYFFSRTRGQNMAHSRWMRMVAGELVTRQALSVAVSRRSMFQGECIDIYKVAMKHWEMPAEKITSVEDEIRKRFLHETVQLLGDRLSRADRLRAMESKSREEAMKEAMEDGFIKI